MKYETLNTEQVQWLFDFFSEKPEEERDNFFKMALKIVKKARLPFDILQKILDAKDEDEMVLRVIKNREDLNRINQLYEEREQQAQHLPESSR